MTKLTTLPQDGDRTGLLPFPLPEWVCTVEPCEGGAHYYGPMDAVGYGDGTKGAVKVTNRVRLAFDFANPVRWEIDDPTVSVQIHDGQVVDLTPDAAVELAIALLTQAAEAKGQAPSDPLAKVAERVAEIEAS